MKQTCRKIWEGMMARCYNQSVQNYKNYGGRGIRVCERWKSFDNFFADVSPRPSMRHQIDRIDNNGDYEPGNWRWATVTEQRRNTRVNRILTLNGESHCLVDWAEKTGINPDTIRSRIEGGWTLEQALTFPAKTVSRTTTSLINSLTDRLEKNTGESALVSASQIEQLERCAKILREYQKKGAR